MIPALSALCQTARRRGLLALTGALIGALPALAADPGFPVQATASLGTGSAQMQSVNGVLTLTGQAEKLGDYAENWKIPGTVLDLRLPKPIDLPTGTNRLSLEVRNPAGKDKVQGFFRVLIGDSKGGEWALSTRLLGRQGTLPVTESFEKLETFPVDISEAGRIDRWVMMALDPVKFDEYTAPVPPLKLLGLRVVPTTLGKFDFEVRNLHPQQAGSGYDPCWDLIPNTLWSERIKPLAPRRFGWGAEDAAPYLKASDLRLTPGLYHYTWEIMDLQNQSTLQSGCGDFTVNNASPYAIGFPLLPAGAYRLQLYTVRDGEKTGRESMYQYVVYANSRSLEVPAALPQKPLSATLPAGALYAKNAPAPLQLSVRDAKPGDRIEYILTSADQRPLGKGEAVLTGSGNNTTIDLSPQFAAGENTVWLEAKLLRDGKQIDALRRVAGVPVAIPELSVAPTNTVLSSKARQLDGKFMRTKGDWHEGATPVVSQLATVLPQFTRWVDEAKDVGYNIVEFSAPWDELEPLPGVYEFRYLDQLVKMAEDRGMFVVLRAHPIDNCVPDWLARQTQRASDGRWHGIWNGGTNVVYTPASEELVKGQEKFLTALSAHYRNDPKMLGYTLTNVFFDHGFIDSPWIGQYTDYSDSMRLAFVKHLREKYGTLAAVRQAHGTDYPVWESIPLPLPQFLLSAEGRVLPRQDKLWQDYIESKKGVMLAFRTRAIEALRKGDPACVPGPYSDTARAFLEDYYRKNDVLVPQGSMEDQYPPFTQRYVVRYEPHGKVSRTARTTDIGMTNLLFYKPGMNTFFNYWFPQWTLDSVTPDVKEAELRIKQWFGLVDRLVGAEPLTPQEATPDAMVIASLDTLLVSWQNIHTSRIFDYLAPYVFRCKNEGVRMSQTYSSEAPGELAGRPYVFVPYSSDLIDRALAAKLEAYVKQGGKLILEGPAGTWAEDGKESGSLRSLLPVKAPSVRTLQTAATEEKATVAVNGILAGLPLSFRIKQWKPPVESQPVAWIDTCARGYFLPARFPSALPEGAQVLATSAEGEPVALRLPYGKGEILAFAGTVDWFHCPGLALRLDNWGKGKSLDAPAPKDPQVLTAAFRKNGKVYAIGRRFIPHDQIEAFKKGTVAPEANTAAPMPVVIQGLPAGKWQVKEMLSGKSCPESDGAAIARDGIQLPLMPGEAFFLELTPQ